MCMTVFWSMTLCGLLSSIISALAWQERGGTWGYPPQVEENQLLSWYRWMTPWNPLLRLSRKAALTRVSLKT